MHKTSIKLAIAAAALAVTPAAAHAAGPPAGVIASGPLVLFYRMAWLFEFLGQSGSDRACQYEENCAG
jgi:hypothetical protein